MLRNLSYFLIALFVGLALYFLYASQKESLTLIVNMENKRGELPRNFRTSNDPWKHPISHKPPSRKGLDHLNVSGSGQFSEQGLKEILKHIPSTFNIIDVDLRQESHGFANGIAVSWYAPRDAANVGKSLSQIEADEEMHLQFLLKQSEVNLHQIIEKPQDVIEKSLAIPLNVQTVSTEKNLTSTIPIGYFRLPITDHLPPSQEQVDRFVAFVETLPPNTWLHFHCEAGEGRTTTILAMYDIMRNGKRNGKSVSFEEIIERQYLIGGSNLLEMPPESSWKYPYAVQRIDFLRKFYESHQ